mgnify:CR=1 FL=1
MPRPDVSDIRREQILTAAMALFSKTGIEATSMNAIAKECGFSKATIYHYFESKDDMVLSLLDNVFAHDEDAFQALQNTEVSVSDRIMSYIDSYAAIVLEQPQLFALFFEFYGNSIRREIVRETLSGYFDTYTDVFTTVFQQGYDTGEFNKGSAELAAESFVALVEGTVLMSFIRKIDLINSLKNSIHLFLSSLG